MNGADARENIQKDLEKFFIQDEKDWVNVNKVNINRIDVDIVTSSSESTKESVKFIENIISKINEKLSDDEKLYLGFYNIYTPEEADFLQIKKPEKKSKKETTFGEIIDNRENGLKYKKEEVKDRAKIISFYSYKGGVGRTIALIQTAFLLAGKGKKVALIDMDVEAPSFNEIFKSDIKTEDGLVKYLYNKVYFYMY